MRHTIALFGESEKGEFNKAHYCKNLVQLSELLGEPPSQDSKGLYFAIQALLYERDILFFRVREEGFSIQDYLAGLNTLKKRDVFPNVAAICMPGVGNSEIIEASCILCTIYNSFLIFNEEDLYDYLTYRTD